VSEIEWADERLELNELSRALVPVSVALGSFAGAVEFGFIATQIKLWLRFDEALMLGMTSAVIGASLALLLMLPVACLAGALTRWRSDACLPFAVGVLGGSLAGWYLWPMGAALLDQAGRLPSAMAFFAMPFGVVGVVHINAKYWVRRRIRQMESGAAPASFTPLASVVTVGLLLVTAFVTSGRSYGSGMALDADAPVLLITVDSLRRDHVSAYAEGTVATPSIDEIADGGVLFENAVTPLPSALPAHAAIMTGIHPVRSGVLTDTHSLGARYETLAERLGNEGYATAGFVSSAALRVGSGIEQGFQAYDDDFGTGIRGLRRLRTAGLVLKWWVHTRGGGGVPAMQERAGEETLGRALAWLGDHGRRPFLLWVHLNEPHAPYISHGAEGAPTLNHAVLRKGQASDADPEITAQLRELYAEEILHTDSLIGDFLDAARAIVDRPMTIVFASVHGEMLGEHGVQFNHTGLYDETVRVPLLIQPHNGNVVHARVPAQVRLMDVLNTILAILGMDTEDTIESGDLSAFWTGTQDRDYASFLMGQHGNRVDEGVLFGYRAAKTDADRGSMLKYIWNPDASQAWLYDLSSDPDENVDISLSQAAVVEALERQVRKELGTAAPEGSRVPADHRTIAEAIDNSN